LGRKQIKPEMSTESDQSYTVENTEPPQFYASCIMGNMNHLFGVKSSTLMAVLEFAFEQIVMFINNHVKLKSMEKAVQLIKQRLLLFKRSIRAIYIYESDVKILEIKICARHFSEDEIKIIDIIIKEGELNSEVSVLNWLKLINGLTRQIMYAFEHQIYFKGDSKKPSLWLVECKAAIGTMEYVRKILQQVTREHLTSSLLNINDHMSYEFFIFYFEKKKSENNEPEKDDSRFCYEKSKIKQCQFTE